MQEQVALLRAGAVDALDLDNIAEELSDVGNERVSASSKALCDVLLMHMLKWDQQPEKRTPSWIFSIGEQRRALCATFWRKTPVCKSSLDEARDACLSERERTGRRMRCHLPVDEFPPECPYDWDDILHRALRFRLRED